MQDGRSEVVGYARGAASEQQAAVNHAMDYTGTVPTGAQSSGGWVL
jgi:hypothetical protein